MTYLPSKRTFLKLGRGAILAAAAGAFAFITGPDGLDAMNLNPSVAVFLVPVVGFVYRWFRGLLDKEPIV